MFSSPVARMLVGFGFFLSVCMLAVIGYTYAGFEVSDAFYMVVITVFGVGYGEVRPIETPMLRSITVLVIIFGYFAAVYTVGGFIQMLVDGELQKVMRSRKMSNGIASLSGHTILCGYGRPGSMMAKELLANRRPFVVVDSVESRIAQAHEDGMLAMVGDATDEHVLGEAGIERAKTLVTMLPDDAANAFICITARDLNKGLEIIARGEAQSAEKKLRRCGADHVVMMASIAAKRAAQLVIRPTATCLLSSADLTEQVNSELKSIGLTMEEMTVLPGTVLEGSPISSIEVGGNHGFLIVAVRSASGEVLINPPDDHVLRGGDVVIVLGHHDDMPTLTSRYSLKRAKMMYRGATY
jgi:voltage-gated potassium channel